MNAPVQHVHVVDVTLIVTMTSQQCNTKDRTREKLAVLRASIEYSSLTQCHVRNKTVSMYILNSIRILKVSKNGCSRRQEM